MELFVSTSDSAAYNASLEEQLYANGARGVLFYRNAGSVIIGRNQNPFREVNLGWCQSQGLPVIRRITGGGTVFHDGGNLNYAFFMPRSEYLPDKYVGILVHALHGLGISEAHIEGQHGVFIGEKKVSGSAFALNSHTVLLHGCILVSTDLTQLSQALKQPGYAFTGGGVASVRSPVTNLSSLIPNITPDRLQQQLLLSAQDALGVAFEAAHLPSVSNELIEKYNSPLWTYGKTPSFQVTINNKTLCFTNGTLESNHAVLEAFGLNFLDNR